MATNIIFEIKSFSMWIVQTVLRRLFYKQITLKLFLNSIRSYITAHSAE